NDTQNFPVLTAAVANPGSTTVQGTLNSTPNATFTLDFYSSAVADPSGFGEGTTFLGSTVVTTNANGDASFLLSLPAVPAGQVVTPTAPNAGGSTSEFSAALAAAAPGVSLSVNDQAVFEGDAGTTLVTFTLTLSAPSVVPVTVTVAGKNNTAIAPGDF